MEHRFATVEHYDQSENTVNIDICYGLDDSGELEYDEESILAILLLSGHVFLNNFWWRDEYPEEARANISVNANCSDVFAWGCADAEPVQYSELVDLFEHYLKDPHDGVSVWCCKKRNMMPQLPVYEVFKKSKIWDIDSMGLDPNPTWPS